MILSKDYNYAVVGASKNREKFGFKVFKNLLSRDFKVYPVNPKEGELLGVKVNKDLFSIDTKMDIVIFVTPPSITLQILEKFSELSVNKAWFQSGSENEKVLDYCKSNNIEFIKDSCVMMKNS